MKQKFKIYISIAIFTLLINNITVADNDSTKIYFQQAFMELKSMLEGKQPINFERAVFITENPFWDNKISYEEFQDDISENISIIQLFANANNKSSEQNFKTTIDFSEKKFDINTLNYTEKEKQEMYLNTLNNFAIFKYITDTIIYYGDKHLPFSYAMSDPFGMTDWKNSQVINLLSSPKKEGNCFALVSLFKIFANRLNSEAYICTAPQHIYIQHKDSKGDFYNVELATATHPGDGSIKTLTYTDYEGIANGIALRRLTNDKENISLCLVNLAKAYEHKLNVKDADFMLQCAELALKYDSLNLNAMLLKAQILEEKTLSYANKQHITDINKLKLDKNINNTFKKLELQLVQLNELGYHQMPLYMQQMILAGLQRKENEKIVVQDKTPNPFPSLKNVSPEDKRYSTLSRGVFEEVHEKKQFEQYGRFTIDTQKKKITKLLDSTNFQCLIDPVVFAWNVDPLASKYAGWSPYNAFNNNPIYYIDPTGGTVFPSTEFKASVFAPVLGNLLANNSTFKNALGSYLTDPKVNLTLEVNDRSVPDNKSAYTSWKATPVTKDGEFQNAYTLEANISFKKNTGKNSNALGRTTLFLHEYFHAYAGLQLKGGNDTKHDVWDDYLGLMKKAVKEYSDDNKLNLNDTQITELSIFNAGQGASVYDNYIKDLATKNNSTVEVEGKAFAKRIVALTTNSENKNKEEKK